MIVLLNLTKGGSLSKIVFMLAFEMLLALLPVLRNCFCHVLICVL